MQDLNKEVKETAQEVKKDVLAAVEEGAEAVQKAVEKEQEKDKAYYSPGEVMKKKGCIGCGGMTLALVTITAALIAALALL